MIGNQVNLLVWLGSINLHLHMPSLTPQSQANLVSNTWYMDILLFCIIINFWITIGNSWNVTKFMISL